MTRIFCQVLLLHLASSSALAVKKMVDYTKGEGCGDDGDFLSWNEMQWDFHGGAKIEHMEAEETCTVQSFNFYLAGFEMRPCMHFCQKLGGGRVLPVNSIKSERVNSFLSNRGMSGFEFWVPIHDEQNEGEWRDF